ncbi:hypothetical protein AT6N2_C0065 [Agrobacterium tumefaciens]|nr:hypothetical protein AT6N2_C0065 [Agrobacterium tumefaciens]
MPGSSRFARQLVGNDGVEVQEADHALFERHDAAAEAALFFRNDIGRRLQVFGANGHHVGDLFHKKSDQLATDIGNDDRRALRRLGHFHAEATGHVDDGNDGAAQVDKAKDVRRRVRHRRHRRPAADFADRHDVDAEFLIAQMEGNDFEICARLLDGVGHDGRFPLMAL